jgi:hypothetical protein
MDLLAERALRCRLTPDRALADLDQATSFVADRGMLTEGRLARTAVGLTGPA